MSGVNKNRNILRCHLVASILKKETDFFRLFFYLFPGFDFREKTAF